MRVRVEHWDIINGRRTAPDHCPVALAVRRQSGRSKIAVSSYSVDLLDGMKDAELPPEARQFVRDFDSGRPVKPFSFELELPR